MYRWMKRWEDVFVDKNNWECSWLKDVCLGLMEGKRVSQWMYCGWM